MQQKSDKDKTVQRICISLAWLTLNIMIMVENTFGTRDSLRCGKVTFEWQKGAARKVTSQLVYCLCKD